MTVLVILQKKASIPVIVDKTLLGSPFLLTGRHLI